MKVKKNNEEVLFADDLIVTLDMQDISDLKDMSANNLRKRIRLCTHSGVDDLIHEMFIIQVRDVYVRPHKHVNKVESFHVIEGLLDVIIFDDSGCVREIIEMGDLSSKLAFYYRMSMQFFHTIIVKSDFVVFHEITSGPFVRSDTVFSEWSPDEEDSLACLNYVTELKDNVKKYHGRNQ